MSGLPPAFAGLSRDEKLALLVHRARERRSAPPAAAEGPRSYPLAFAQQRFWFLAQLDPGSYADHVFRAFRLAGPLDRPALERALVELTRRHAVLRSHVPVPVPGDELQQVVETALPGGSPLASLVDLGGLPGARREAAATTLAGEESRRPFDLARGPLLRARLLRLGPDDHALLLCLHHIICDGRSLGILLSDLGTLYGACVAGQPSPLPPLRGSFGDFVLWQRERLTGQTLARELAFWRERLAGAPPVLELPADHPRRQMASQRGDAVACEIAAGAAAGVRSLAQAARATPFMALLALFDLLLARYTGQEDLVVGVAVANRDRAEVEGIAGCFASVVLVRTRVRRAASFRELLLQVRHEALAAFAHAELPFEKLVEELQPDRNLSHNPLFQVMLALQPADAGALALPGLAAAPLPVARQLAKLDLTLDLAEAAGGWRGYFEYSTDLFEAPTIARLAGHFQALLAAALAEPDRGAGELPMLAAEERRQILLDWNQRWSGPPPSPAAAVAAQARRTPDAPAVVFDGEHLTFAELNRQANRLARRLRRLGVGPETVVGVCLERSLEMPAILLAVLRSGGAWMPLDPEYPRERLALMIEDAGARVLLAQERLASRLGPTDGGGTTAAAAAAAAGAGRPALVAVDRLDLAAEDPSDLDGPQDEADPESLAYVVYTSGSTGRPKGVAVPRRAMANHVAACARRYRLGPDDRVLQFTSISFDITSEEIFPVWISGGAVVPRPPGLFPSFAELAALIERHRITVVDLPTAYWHEWVGELARTRTPPPAPLRLVVIGTEQALPERVADWLELCGDRVRLNNSYASTEATVTALVFEPGPGDRARFRAGDRVPVGSTLTNCCAYVLDAAGEPVPVGVPGDVYVGGPNVSRGYLNAPAATAASFVPDPFAAALGHGGGRRMYRQGDVGRWLPGGVLEYLGRRDEQVKIRGFRIEPAEVAAVLARHPAVKDCAVVVRSDGRLGKRLVGYLTLEAGAAAAPPAAAIEQLRDFLRTALPEHMVPAALVPLAALPLTPNGRVDLRALPDPPAGGGDPADPASAANRAGTGQPGSGGALPRGAAQEMLAGIWCEVLGLARVGADDNFFDLGGHSLLGTQLVSRVREQLRVELPMRALFESPTPRGLARRIEELRRAGTGPPPPRIAPVPRGPAGTPLPASFAQQRLWFLDRLEPGSATYNVPLSLHLRPAAAAPGTAPARLDVAALAAAIAGVVRRHEALRTTFVAVDGQPRQLVHPPPAAPRRLLPVVDLAALDPDRRAAESRRRAAAEARRPFSLAAGPLLRATLLGLGGGEHLLLVTMHHVVGDGWSLPIFVRELAALYAAHVAGAPAALPALPIQVADFAHWQREWLQGAVLAAELSFWRQQLHGLPPLVELPLDRPRPAERSWRGAGRSFFVGGELPRALPAAGRRLGATPFMMVLAGLAALLHRYGGQAGFAVGVPVAGRNRVEIEPLIGCFVNTLALRCDVAPEATAGALVARLRDTVLDADAHQDLPFEKLVEELSPERDMSRTPLFQVMLAFQNLPRQEFVAAGLAAAQAPISTGTAKFDLTLSVEVEREELALHVEYGAELFDAATIGRLADHLVQLLAGVAATPERRIGELPLLGAAERHQLAVEWNDSAARDGTGARDGAAAATAAAALEETFDRLFAARAAAWPERVAASRGAASLTYGELDRQAGRCARALLRDRHAAESPVPVYADRGLAWLAAVLGTWKAGAAYLPLDPRHPPRRSAQAIAASGAARLLAARDLLPALAQALGELPEAAPRPRILPLEEALADGAGPGPRTAPGPAGEAARRRPPGSLAYVIFTSGSTGVPKGAMVEHRGMINHLRAKVLALDLGPEDVVAQTATPTFDVSVWQLLAAALVGGRTHVLPDEAAQDPLALAAAVEAAGITVVETVPSLLRAMLDELEALPPGSRPGFARLRWLVSTGEALPPELIRRWFALYPRVPLVNAYGPTECSDDVTHELLLAADPPPPGGVTAIGRPLVNTRLYVVDPGLRPVPIGVPGELLVGGAGVGRGYLGDGRRTAAAFVPDPFASALDLASPEDGAGGRLYRTGDLVRRRGDGRLDFLGRIDQQVKVLGHRIEVGEIEAALGRQPAVSQGVVVARPGPPGTPRLAAYYVPAAGAQAASPADLRAALRRELPETLIPSWFVPLPALPLLPSGKVDRAALPAPDGDGAGHGRELVAPAGPVEERLAAIWGEVLRRDRIGARDDFFELGGHSLLATQVLSRMRQAFGVELPLRVLFLKPTIESIALAIQEIELERADGEVLASLLSELEGESA